MEEKPTAPCTWDDFFQVTRVNWRRVDREPDRAPDFESGEGSRYWNTRDSVYRSSDHWNGDIHGSDWLLPHGQVCGQGQDRPGEQRERMKSHCAHDCLLWSRRG